LYVSFAVTPPAGIRSREIFTGEARDDPTLQVVAEGDDGVTISGMKMLATGAVFADEVWIGNLTAIDDKRESETPPCALPVNPPGFSLWAREPYERHARHEADYPLSFRFDEPTRCWSATWSRCRGSASSCTTTAQCRAASISRRQQTATRTTNPTCVSGPRWG